MRHGNKCVRIRRRYECLGRGETMPLCVFERVADRATWSPCKSCKRNDNMCTYVFRNGRWETYKQRRREFFLDCGVFDIILFLSARASQPLVRLTGKNFYMEVYFPSQIGELVRHHLKNLNLNVDQSTTIRNLFKYIPISLIYFRFRRLTLRAIYLRFKNLCK